MYGQWASLGMGNQQMGWTPPGGAAPTWKLGGGMGNQQMGWSAPGGGSGSKAGGMGVYSPQMMQMLQQRLAMMRGGMPSSGGFSGIAAQPMPTMPANPGAFQQYQPPIQAQPMPVQPAPAPTPVQPAPAPVRAAPSPYAPLPGIGRRLWANRE